MIHLQVLDTDIVFVLTDTNEAEIKAQMMCLAPETLIFIIEENNTIERQFIFN